MMSVGRACGRSGNIDLEKYSFRVFFKTMIFFEYEGKKSAHRGLLFLLISRYIYQIIKI